MDLGINWIEIWVLVKEWYWIPLMLIYISVIFTILIENRNPTKTIAWILVIILIPLLGILLYYFFGQDFKKDLYFKKIDKKTSAEFIRNWKKINHLIEKDFEKIETLIGSQVKVFKYLNHTLSSPPFIHNHVRLLRNGEEKFPEFLAAIQQAKHHIHLEYYIFEPDHIGLKLIDTLIKKSNEGVEVRITTDDFGSPKLNKRYRELFKNSKVQYQTFLPVRFNSLANSNFRNHRKILIVDGEIAFVGGINISDKYINNNQNALYWRDTSLMIKGDAVNLLQLRFWMDWKMADGEDFNVFGYDYVKIHDEVEKGAVVGFAFTSPGASVPSAMESMILAITLAKRKIRITTPYFIPSDEFKSALLIAANSGVEVELLMPKVGDSLIVQEASLSFTKRLMEHGVKVYLYEKGFVHAKTITIDDDLAFIGTVNLDNRSFFINFELTAVVHDKILISNMIKDFDEDRFNSMLMTIEKWKNVSMFRRAFASICRLLAPIL
ncbi:MAG TPA: cardiolipin synthase [Faecalibacter sp.]